MQPHVGMREQEGPDGLRLMRRQVVAITWISRPFGWLATMSPRNSTNAALVCRGTVCPSTSPDCVFSAANSEGAMPVGLEAVALGPTGRQRQHGIEPVQGLIAVFSSTANTAAWSGGFT